jgi:hypothetical protein
MTDLVWMWKKKQARDDGWNSISFGDWFLIVIRKTANLNVRYSFFFSSDGERYFGRNDTGRRNFYIGFGNVE